MIRNFAKSLPAAAAVCLILSACGDDKSTGPAATLPQLQKWSFSGQEINYVSGIAVRNRDSAGKPVPGLTVWLTDQTIDCATDKDDLPSRSGGWIEIEFPNTSLGKASVGVMVGHWPVGQGLGGNIVDRSTATLTKADTSSEKSVAGSLDIHIEAFDPEDDFGKADIKGNFSVPYCPEP